MSVMAENPQRPRSKSRTFSFKSDHSQDSKKRRESFKESSEEKRRSHLNASTKANPNAAINEAQPIAAALEAPTLGSLRSVQHTDSFGNPISEPDLSNPTRPRWERPLDTIRSFEAAIDKEYKRRSSLIRADTTPSDLNSGFASRRSSYYGGYDNPRSSQVGGYYSGRSAVARDSYFDNNGYGAPPPVPGPSRNRFSQRMQSDPNLPPAGRYSNGNGHGYNNGYNNGYGNGQVYPNQGYHQSRDTVNTGDSGGSQSEPWANSTGPSSDNSSIDRPAPPVKQPDPGEQYGFTGFGGDPILEEYAGQTESHYGVQNGQNGGHYPVQPYASGPPAPPPKQGMPRVLSKKGGTVPGHATQSSNGNVSVSPVDNGEKRKSWFKRRFSKE